MADEPDEAEVVFAFSPALAVQGLLDFTKSETWQMCHDFDHRLDHGVARTAWPWSSKTSSADEQRRERNIKLMSKDYWNSGNRLQALNLRVTGGKRYSSGSGWSFF